MVLLRHLTFLGNSRFFGKGGFLVIMCSTFFCTSRKRSIATLAGLPVALHYVPTRCGNVHWSFKHSRFFRENLHMVGWKYLQSSPFLQPLLPFPNLVYLLHLRGWEFGHFSPSISRFPRIPCGHLPTLYFLHISSGLLTSGELSICSLSFRLRWLRPPSESKFACLGVSSRASGDATWRKH